MLYRFKGINKIDELDDKIIFECMKCQSRLTVHKNYGNLHVVCKCGHSCNIYTGRDTRPVPKKELEIPKELKVFDFIISEYQHCPIVKGKQVQQGQVYILDSF